MIPRRIAGSTRYLGAPRNGKPDENGKCGHLAIRTSGDPEHGRGFCESAWEPTPAELDVLNKGGSIILRIHGWQPPVALYGEHPEADKPTPVEQVTEHPDLARATCCPHCDLDNMMLVMFCQNSPCPFRRHGG